MQKILNNLFLFLKYILLIVSFSVNVYIVLLMYHRLDKNIIEGLPIFLPFILLLVLYIVNVIYKQKRVTGNLFYNLTCCLVFTCILLVEVRTIFDKSMLLNEIMGYGVNFSYYSEFIPFMKIMIYCLIFSNICFMLLKNDRGIINTNEEVL